MRSTYHYYLYFPRSATEHVLRDLAKQMVPLDRPCSVTVILPEGRKVLFPSWSDSFSPPPPISVDTSESIPRFRVALGVDTLRAEQRQFHNAMSAASGSAVLPLDLRLDLKLDQPGSFAQLDLSAYTSSASSHLSTHSFHNLITQMLSTNHGLCAILDYERGFEASLRWLRDHRVILPQPIPIQCESSDEECNFSARTPFSPLNEDLAYIRRFDHAVERWQTIF